jgi:hypothetical protein
MTRIAQDFSPAAKFQIPRQRILDSGGAVEEQYPDTGCHIYDKCHFKHEYRALGFESPEFLEMSFRRGALEGSTTVPDGDLRLG